MVNFDLYKNLAPDFYPTKTIEDTIQDLIGLISRVNLEAETIRETPLVRLNYLRSLIQLGSINSSLRWC